jgi:hypothetical protein
MIEKLQDVDEDTVQAIGMKFDLEKVLEMALKTLRNLVGWVAMRFPNCEAPTFSHVHEENPRPFDGDGYKEIATAFREAKRLSYDVTDYHYLVTLGPFVVHLHLLGFEALHGPIINCQTTFGSNWEDLDPTPIMLIRMRAGVEIEIDLHHKKFLERMLGSLRENGVQAGHWERAGLRFFALSFPYADFGTAHGTIRICRYLESELYGQQGEEEE